MDFATVNKLYSEDEIEGARRYSPARVVGLDIAVFQGDPDPNYISTSYVERGNLTIRMQCRRLTRLTNAFSKKPERLAAAVALHFGWYNFVHRHGTIRCSPAMEAGIVSSLWTVEDLVAEALRRTA